MFLGNGARAICLTFTLYDKNSDWWVRSQLFFEYGVADQVMTYQKTFYPFRPSVFETQEEKKQLIIDILRSLTNIGMAASCCLINICKIKQKRKFIDSEVTGALVEFAVLLLFLIQLFSMFKSTPTHQLFD